jgi:Holliday junction resolvase RusA-like endonuclease
MIRFEVVGLPAPQGSKSAVVRGGHAVVLEGASNGQRARHRDWRNAVADKAREIAATLDRPFTGPLDLIVVFRHPMPASRPARTRAIGQAWKPTAPDLSKLVRALEDGLQAGGLIVDDARIVVLSAVKVEVVGWTGATVELSELDPVTE